MEARVLPARGHHILQHELGHSRPTDIAVIIVAVVVFVIVRNRRLAKQREAERMQEILNTPLESLADAELADLEKKYAGESDAPPVQPTRPSQP